MTRQPLLACLLAVLVGAGLLWAGEPWRDKPYTQWTMVEVQKVLQASPWARPAQESLARPPADSATSMVVSVPVAPRGTYRTIEDVGALWAPDTRTLGQAEFGQDASGQAGESSRLGGTLPVIVRWTSALTVRQALVREQQLQGLLDEEGGRGILSDSPQHYVIVVGPLLGMASERLQEEALRASTYLEPRRSKQKVFPEKVQFSWYGKTPVGIVFWFPRGVDGKPVLGPGEKTVRFHSQVGAREIETEFELRKMKRDGQPDL